VTQGSTTSSKQEGSYSCMAMVGCLMNKKGVSVGPPHAVAAPTDGKTNLRSRTTHLLWLKSNSLKKASAWWADPDRGKG
jgi:hypothetical protein